MYPLTLATNLENTYPDIIVIDSSILYACGIQYAVPGKICVYIDALMLINDMISEKKNYLKSARQMLSRASVIIIGNDTGISTILASLESTLSENQRAEVFIMTGNCAIQSLLQQINMMHVRLIDRHTGPDALASQIVTALETSPGEKPVSHAPLPTFTVAEERVLKRMQEGFSLTQIAEMTGRSVKTISSQKMSAMKKMGAGNDFQLILWYSWFHHRGGVSQS